MAVRRIVPNVSATRIADAMSFYGDILGLSVVMDQGWIVTFAANDVGVPQISVATEGGSGAAVPDLSIEVDNFEEIERRVRGAGLPIEYGPIDEPWGVRRFYVRDPFGRLVNILNHL